MNDVRIDPGSAALWIAVAAGLVIAVVAVLLVQGPADAWSRTCSARAG